MIDLCSSSDDNNNGSSDECSSDECYSKLCNFFPIKPKTVTSLTLKDERSNDERTPIDIIRSIIPNVTDDDFHDESKRIPVLSRMPEGLSMHQLFTLMIGTVPADRICHRKPTAVTYSSVFVIDLDCVRCIDDLRADDNGAWTHGGKPRRNYQVDLSKDGGEVTKITLLTENITPLHKNQFTLVRLYHRHKSTTEFQRRISYAIDCGGNIIQFAVMQYLFEEGIEVPVTKPPHGNAKKDLCKYQRTQKSTLTRIKKMPEKPKLIVATLDEKAGGMLGASSTSELPRNQRQVYNSHRLMPSVVSNKIDPIFELVQECKVDLLPGGRGFIRCVNFESGPSCVLALDGQLRDVIRFCTNPGASSVFAIDPMFNLGKFYVTLTTFTYTQVVNKATNVSPTFF